LPPQARATIPAAAATARTLRRVGFIYPPFCRLFESYWTSSPLPLRPVRQHYLRSARPPFREGVRQSGAIPRMPEQEKFGRFQSGKRNARFRGRRSMASGGTHGEPPEPGSHQPCNRLPSPGAARCSARATSIGRLGCRGGQAGRPGSTTSERVAQPCGGGFARDPWIPGALPQDESRLAKVSGRPGTTAAPDRPPRVSGQLTARCG
jgi:hypothetical protein